MRFALCALVVSFFIGCVAGTGYAQNDPHAVTFETDNEISGVLVGVEKEIQQGNYNNAANVLMSILKRKGISAVTIRDPKDVNLSVGVREKIQSLLIKLPNDAKMAVVKEQVILADSYLRRFQQENNEEYLYKMFAECFLSSKIAEAATLLAEHHLENGFPARSFSLLEDYTRKYNPAPNLRMLGLLFMSGAMCGKYNETLGNKLRADFTGQKISLMGKDYATNEFVDYVQTLRVAPPAQNPPGATINLKWNVKIPELQVTSKYQTAPFKGKRFPTIYGDSVFVHAGSAIKRFSLQTGQQIGKDFCLSDKVEIRSYDYPLSVRSCLVHEGILYANLIVGYGVREPQVMTELYVKTDFAAFNINDGKLLWRSSQSNKGDLEFINFINNSYMNSPAKYHEGKIFFEVLDLKRSADIYFLALSATSGKKIFKTYVGSTSKTFSYKLENRNINEPLPILRGSRDYLCIGEYLYFGTSYGAMGALNINSGDLIWCRKFAFPKVELPPRKDVPGVQSPRLTASESAMVGWECNMPALLNEDTVIFTPQRSSEVFFLDRFNGAEKSGKISLSKRDRQIIGLADGKLFIYDDMVTEFDANSKNTSVQWGAYGEANGQGAVSQGCIFLPLNSSVAVLSIAQKRVIHIADMKDTQDGGNIVIQGNNLVACSHNMLTMFEIVPMNKAPEAVAEGKFVPVQDLTPKQNYFAGLVHQLGAAEPAKQNDAFDELLRWCPEALDVILQNRNHANPVVRIQILNILRITRWTSKENIEKVFNEHFPKLTSKDKKQQRLAETSIMNLGIGALPLLEKQLLPDNQKDLNLRARAANCIGAISPPAYLSVPALLNVIKTDPVGQVKYAAFGALKNFTEIKIKGIIRFNNSECEEIERIVKESNIIPVIKESKEK